MRSFLILGVGMGLAEAICHHGTNLFHRRAEGAAFGYTNLQGPLAWHDLDSGNELCASGKQQSPISVTADNSSPVDGTTLEFEVTDVPNGAELENLGTTLEVEAKGSMSLNGKTWSLAQFHFHTPSEHRIEEEYYPMEVHFVFQDDDENLAVVGAMVEIAAMENTADFLRGVFTNLDDATAPGSVAETGPLSFEALKNHVAQSTVWQYDGSLTTPSCDEGVAWNVLQNPLFVDATLYRKIKSVMKFNSRYTQNSPGEVNLLENACSAS